MCSYGVCLSLHLVLLLHKKMDAATKNDALDTGQKSYRQNAFFFYNFQHH